MRTRLTFVPFAALFVTMFVAGCGDDSTLVAPVTPADLDDDARVEQTLAEAERLQKLAVEADGGAATLVLQASNAAKSPGAALVIVPPGSVDALAGALAAARTGGVVLLKSGMHAESGTVTITRRVNLIGEPGAILQVDTTPYPAATFNEPALHINGAAHVVVWGIDIRPVQASGNTAILLEDAPRATIGRNTIGGHQVGILLHQSDWAYLFGNSITVSADGFYGIEVINGDFAAIVRNEIANAPAFGIFASDRNGTLLFNNVHGNTIGIILCKPPFGDAVLPGGEMIGAELTATGWVARWNNATNNAWGYLAIDGANSCTLFHNNASNNSVYDVEFAGDSFRFGFFTPTSSNCTAIIADPAIVVKNCGLNNTVVGGAQVDTTADPCF